MWNSDKIQVFRRGVFEQGVFDDQTHGCDPLNPGMPGGSSMLTIVPSAGTTGCGYNNSGMQGLTVSNFGVFPDSTPYKQSASELRQYIINLEATRKLRDLADVNFQRSPPARRHPRIQLHNGVVGTAGICFRRGVLRGSGSLPLLTTGTFY